MCPFSLQKLFGTSLTYIAIPSSLKRLSIEDCKMLCIYETVYPRTPLGEAWPSALLPIHVWLVSVPVGTAQVNCFYVSERSV